VGDHDSYSDTASLRSKRLGIELANSGAIELIEPITFLALGFRSEEALWSFRT